MTRHVIGALVLAATVSATASATEVRDNPQVFKDVARSVRSYVYFTIFDDVRASVDSGTVTLSGRVTLAHKQRDLERAVARVPGVLAVRNQLTVLPASQFDDSLRTRSPAPSTGIPASGTTPRWPTLPSTSSWKGDG